MADEGTTGGRAGATAASGHPGTAVGAATAPALRAGRTTAGRTVARLARAVEQAVGDVELTLAQYRVLAFLSEVDGATASLVAGRLGVSRPSVTGIVDGLVGRRLVERVPCDTDRRRVEHHLTPAGAEVLVRADAAAAARLAALAGHGDAALGTRAEDGLEAWAELLHRALASLVADR